MKLVIMLWLVTAGAGVSYAIYMERQNRLKLLNEMQQGLEKLVYFMYQWRMPAEEAFAKMVKEPFPMLHPFFTEMLEEIIKREVENLGDLWFSKSEIFFERTSIQKEIQEVWCNCFLNIPMEPGDLQRTILMKKEVIETYLKTLQDKYRVEQKLVWTLGLCTSAFLCLIIW